MRRDARARHRPGQMDPADAAHPEDPALRERLRAVEARLPALQRTLALLAASHRELGARLAALRAAMRTRRGGTDDAAATKTSPPMSRLAQELEGLKRQVLRLAAYRPSARPGTKPKP